MKQVLLYLPVIHVGYEEFLDRHPDAEEILVLGTGFRQLYPSLTKDIRALSPHHAAQYLRLAVRRPHIRVIEPTDLPSALAGDVLVLPDEEIMRDLATRYGLEGPRTVVFDRTFLRWDRNSSTAQSPVAFDRAVSASDLPDEFLTAARVAAQRSSDWWRRVGAVAARDGEILMYAWNRHHPTEYTPYIDGDPRGDFERGVRADLSTAIHAEASLVAQAARSGVRLEGCDLYSTTFPCPACARLVAEIGVKRCFFSTAYSVLDGQHVLRAAGIELIWVDVSDEASTASNGAVRPGEN